MTLYKRYIQQFFAIMLCIVVMQCKSAKSVIASGEASNSLSAKQVIKEHKKKDAAFKTMQAKVRIDLTQGDKTQGITFSYRMEKDKTIWLSAPLGIARMLITPNQVQFYNKQDNVFFDGSYELLSDVVGVDLDFNKVQNILLGQAIYDLKNQPHKVDVNNNSYALQPKNQNELLELFYLINPSHFKMDSLQLSQQLEKRFLQVDYLAYQEEDKQILPKEIGIIAVENSEEVKINLDFKSVSLNQDLRFPFRIPKGYKEIIIE